MVAVYCCRSYIYGYSYASLVLVTEVYSDNALLKRLY
jgi:hypothetical protein